MARDDPKDTKSSDAPEPKDDKSKPRKPRTPSKPRVNKDVVSKDAKNLRDLIGKLSDQNTPHTGKDVEALAKETIKIVAQSQKEGSESLKREATKALLAIRNLIEKSEKLNEVKRTKIMGDLEKVSLDASNASFLMLSIAKEQAKNIKAQAIREATAEKLKATEAKKNMMAEAKAKIDKSKADAKEAIAKQKEAAKTSIEAKKTKLKQEKDDARAANVERMNRLHQQKADFALAKEAANAKIKQDRAEAATKIKRIKLELNDKYKQKQLDLRDSHDKMKDAQLLRNKARIQKLRDIKEDMEQRKFDNAQKNKLRIQKIRDMKAEAAIKIKQMKDDAKAESVINKLELKNKYNQIQSEARERKRKHEKNADNLTSKIKDGIYDANPLIHAAVEIGSGIVGHLAKRMGDKKKEKQLNKLKHTQQTGTPNATPNATPAPTPPANPNAPPAANPSGGMFDGILSMLPSITGIVSGIAGFLSAIPNVLGTAWKILGKGGGLKVLGIAGVIITSVLDFMDGFNNASKIFGEKVEDGDFMKRTYAGFVNVVGGILSIFDTVAGWFGFAPDLQGKYEKAMTWVYKTIGDIVDGIVNTVKGIFDSMMNAIRSLAGKVGNILSYIPGAGGAAKALQEFANAGKSGEIKAPDSPSAVSQISAKQNTVNDLKNNLSSPGKQPSVAAMIDNSVKASTTNVITQRLDTRNNDLAHNLYGYGGSTVFGRR